MTARLTLLRHIDMSRVAVSFSQTRRPDQFGMYASLTPLRFEGGRDFVVRRGRKWAMQRLLDGSGREMLYILNFYLPRFLDLPFSEKLCTIVHELWHINPRFDGDLRRFSGRCYAHGSSEKRYDAHVSQLAECWLVLNPPPPIYHFLQFNFQHLIAQFGSVRGRRIPAPKLIPWQSSIREAS
jgi:hypothetical protein